MIYATEARARAVAAEINRERGNPYRAIAVLSRHGWTVTLDSPHSSNAINQ